MSNTKNINLVEEVNQMNEKGATREEMVKLLLKYDPKDVYNEMLKTNEDFRKFIKENEHKSLEEMTAIAFG